MDDDSFAVSNQQIDKEGEMESKSKWMMFAVTALLAACASTGGTPKWAMNTGEWMKGQKDKAFYGVGRASSGVKDKVLRMEAAENMARTELSKQLRTWVGYAAEEYKGADGQFMERTNRVFSSNFVSGVEIVDRGYDGDGTAYALAQFDLARAKQMIETSNELSKENKEYLQKSADNLFEKLRKSAEQSKAQ